MVAVSTAPPAPTRSPNPLAVGIVRAEALRGVGILAVRHPPGHTLPWHRHGAPGLVLVRRGAYRQQGRCRAFECGAGQMAVVPAAARHREEISREGSDAVLVFFTDPALLEEAPARTLLEQPRRLRAPWVPQLSDALAHEIAENDACSRLALEGLGLELLGRASRLALRGARGRPPAWLARARELIEDELSRSIGLDELAVEAGVSRSHLARSFRAWFDMTPGAYLRSVRLEHAAVLLRDTDEPLADIALASGFCDQSHLTNAFRRRFGTTPRAFREAGGKRAGKPGAGATR